MQSITSTFLIGAWFLRLFHFKSHKKLIYRECVNSCCIICRGIMWFLVEFLSCFPTLKLYTRLTLKIKWNEILGENRQGYRACSRTNAKAHLKLEVESPLQMFVYCWKENATVPFISRSESLSNLTSGKSSLCGQSFRFFFALTQPRSDLKAHYVIL